MRVATGLVASSHQVQPLDGAIKHIPSCSHSTLHYDKTSSLPTRYPADEPSESLRADGPGHVPLLALSHPHLDRDVQCATCFISTLCLFARTDLRAPFLQDPAAMFGTPSCRRSNTIQSTVFRSQNSQINQSASARPDPSYCCRFATNGLWTPTQNN